MAKILQVGSKLLRKCVISTPVSVPIRGLKILKNRDTGAVTTDFLLLETGSFMLLEDGLKVIL